MSKESGNLLFYWKKCNWLMLVNLSNWSKWNHWLVSICHLKFPRTIRTDSGLMKSKYKFNEKIFSCKRIQYFTHLINVMWDVFNFLISQVFIEHIVVCRWKFRFPKEFSRIVSDDHEFLTCHVSLNKVNFTLNLTIPMAIEKWNSKGKF